MMVTCAGSALETTAALVMSMMRCFVASLNVRRPPCAASPKGGTGSITLDWPHVRKLINIALMQKAIFCPQREILPCATGPDHAVISAIGDVKISRRIEGQI
jgi:hypothetical protein